MGVENKCFDWHYVFTALCLQFVNSDVMIQSLTRTKWSRVKAPNMHMCWIKASVQPKLILNIFSSLLSSEQLCFSCWTRTNLESYRFGIWFSLRGRRGKELFFVLLLQNQVRGQPLCLRVSSTERENVFGRHQRLLCFYFLCLCFSSCFVKEISYFLLFFFVQTEIKSQLGERAEGEGNVSLSKRCARTLSTTVTVK